MSARSLTAILLLLLVGAVTPAQAAPPDLTTNHVLACAAQEPETPIEFLLVGCVEEKPTCRTCDILLDLVVPPLRLRHVCPMMSDCPCFKNCCKRVHKALGSCGTLVRRCLVPEETGECVERTEHYPQAEHEEECSEPCGQPYPHCPAGLPRGCPMQEENAEASDSEVAEEEVAGAPEVIEVMPKEEPEQIDIMPQECDEENDRPPAKVGHFYWFWKMESVTVCPHLQKKAEKAAAAGTKKDKKVACPATPLEGMDRLMKAFHLYRKAEHCRTDGQTERACRLYEKVKALCPGSRFEHLACRRLEQIYAAKGMPDVQPGVEEAEPLPCQPPEVKPNVERLRGECVKLVDELRAKAHQLLDEGHYAEARALAEVAYSLNNDCDRAVLLLAKAKALLEAPKDEEKAEEAEPLPMPGCDVQKQGCFPDPDGEDAEVQPPSEDPCEPPACGSILIQPSLPPIDPKVVEALEKVLRQVGDPTIPQRIIQVDDKGGEEEQYLLPPDCDGLYIESSEEELYLEDDEGDGRSQVFVGRKLHAKLPDLVDCLRQHVCCDIDVATPGLVRGVVTFQVGGVQCGIVCDGWGHRLVLVSLTLDGSGDLREVQQDHNERMLQWIESINSGGNQPDNDDTATEEDQEEQDLLYYNEPYRLFW